MVDMKDKKVALGIPHYDVFNSAFLRSALMLFKKTTCAMHLILEKSPYIHKSRNRAFKEAQNVKADYLLMIDCDMVVPPDALQRLINLNKDVASGVYYEKDYPHYPLVYEWTGSDDASRWHQSLVDVPEVPFKVDMVGTGFILISKQVLDYWTPEVYKKYGKPFSPISYDDNEGGEIAGEDSSFCKRISKTDFEIWADPTFDLGHSGPQIAGKEQWAISKQMLRVNEGWMAPEEMKFLEDSAATFPDVVEIGSWKGKSTGALLKGSASSGGTVCAVDHFNGSPTDESEGFATVQDVYAQFMAHVGNASNLNVMRMSSKDAAPYFDTASVDMVFIDADHSYEACSRDIDMWLPKIKFGGQICGHDYDVCSGVKQAVDERFEADKIGHIGSIWFVEV